MISQVLVSASEQGKLLKAVLVFFLRKDVVPDRMELECQRSHLVDAGRISQKSGRYQLLHPLHDEKEIALDCPQAGFLW